MPKITAILIISFTFLISMFVYWKVSKSYFQNKVFNIKTWKTGTTKLAYWQGAVLFSIAITIFVTAILKAQTTII